MAEHIKMSPREAKEKVAALRKIVLDTYDREIKDHPFFRELRAGWSLEYCARVAVEMMALFYDGVYRRYH